MQLYSGWTDGSAEEIEYFSYLEARSRLPGGIALPTDGRPLVAPGWSEGDVAHLGFSSVVRRQFLDRTREVIGREPSRPSDSGWRRDRAARLRRLFAVMPTSRIDVYAASPSFAARALHRDLQLGGWFRIKLVRAKAVGPGEPVFATVSARDGEALPAHVRRIERATVEEKRALRRVFSLDHIGDLGGEEPGPDPAPDTPPPAPLPLGVRKALKSGRATVVFGGKRLREAQSGTEPEINKDHGRGIDWDQLVERGFRNPPSGTPLAEEA
ncbi:hypothetical protein [Brevundimonas lutea]|uniref:hypothetical protein n=1 Tax=Brevundimonas lutea TaxID=2293980 RepID=UPI000F024DE9|nr:hypothetical protein [Brevundimonas lutea]